MGRKTFIVASGCIPLLACTIIPLIIFGFLVGQWGTNLFWGLIFGLGWWVAQSVFGQQHWRIAADIGLFVWPPLVFLGLLLLGGFIWKEGRRARKNFLLLLGISCLPIVPAETVSKLYATARVPPDFMVLVNAD